MRTHQRGEYHQRGLPAERAHQRDRERRKQELAERAGRRAETKCRRAPLRRHQFAERADHDGERAARQAEADQHAGRQSQHQRRGRIGHQVEAEPIEHGAEREHARRAVAVGNGAGDRLADAPQQILNSQREGEDVAAPMVGLRQRRKEKPERRTRPEADHRDQAAAQHQHNGVAPEGNRRTATRRLHRHVRPGPIRAPNGAGWRAYIGRLGPVITNSGD